MPNTPPQRLSDYELIRDTAANKEAIANIKEDVGELKDDVHALTEKLDEHVDEVSAKLSDIIKRLDAQTNQFLGAGRLARVLWYAFPTASAAFAWFAAKHT